MKRRLEQIEDPKKVEEDTINLTQNVIETSTDLNLKSVCTFTHPNELNSAFCLQSRNEYILLRSKNDSDVMKFEKNLANHQTKFHISSFKFKCSVYQAVESLNVDEKKLFNSCSHSEKNDLMLRQDIFPHCVMKSYQVVKNQLSPYCKEGNEDGPVLASLSSQGSLELSSLVYNKDNHNLVSDKITELCDIRKESFSLETFKRYKKLVQVLNEITFRNFDWCPKIIESVRFLAAVTKSNEILIYSLDATNQVALQKSEKFGKPISEVKWIIIKRRHFLFVANSEGGLTRYSIEVSKDGKISKLEKLDETNGELNIAISNIQAEIVDDSALIVCSKAHSLEIFYFGKNGVKSLTEYIGLSVTGVTSISNSKPDYLVTTLNNKIFYLQLLVSDNDLKIIQCAKVDNSVNPDFQPSKYAAYGITASKNKVLVFIALYPRTVFDHLELKQPICVSVNMLPFNCPYQMLLENESLQLTDYYDCVEVVRYTGSIKCDSLEPLETMKYRIAMSEEFLYYLKLQLLTVNSKVLYYKSRSEKNYLKQLQTTKPIKKLIEVINAYFLLKFITSKRKKLSEQAQLSIRCLCNFIRDYISEKFEIELFKTTQDILKSDFEAQLAKCKISTSLDSEICSYCDAIINKDHLVCEAGHQLNRCVLTKLQIPITINNACSNCYCCVLDLDTLKKVTGKSSSFLCPFCDQKFIFS